MVRQNQRGGRLAPYRLRPRREENLVVDDIGNLELLSLGDPGIGPFADECDGIAELFDFARESLITAHVEMDFLHPNITIERVVFAVVWEYNASDRGAPMIEFYIII